MEIKVNQHGNYFLKIRTIENRKKKKERERIKTRSSWLIK